MPPVNPLAVFVLAAMFAAGLALVVYNLQRPGFYQAKAISAGILLMLYPFLWLYYWATGMI